MSMSTLPAVEIDLNDRVGGTCTPVRLSQLPSQVWVGMKVEAFESEDEISSTATIVGVERGFALLEVDWRGFHDADIARIRARSRAMVAAQSESATMHVRVAGQRRAHVQGMYGLNSALLSAPNPSSQMNVAARTVTPGRGVAR